MFIIGFVTFLTFLIVSRSSEYNQNSNPVDVVHFLQRFGYMQANYIETNNLPQDISKILKDVQRYGKIAQTGKLDNDTLQLIRSPRCGVPDMRTENRQKRNSKIFNRWNNKQTLTYYIDNWPNSLGETIVNRDIKVGLETWGHYARLKFRRVYNGNADINISFASKDHGDKTPFDGSGSTLGHAYFWKSCMIHFDLEEDWKAEPKDIGIHFYSVAVHELGHCFGLNHSKNESSVMQSYYKIIEDKYILNHTDIKEIQKLYSNNNNARRTPNKESNTPVGNSSENKPIVPNVMRGGFDSVAIIRNQLLIFKDEYVWKMKNSHDVEAGYPIKIKQMFVDMPECVKHINAVYEMQDGNILLFADNVYWLSNGRDFIEDSPKDLRRCGSFNGMKEQILIQDGRICSI